LVEGLNREVDIIDISEKWRNDVFIKCTYHLQSYWCQRGNPQSFQNDKLPRHW